MPSAYVTTCGTSLCLEGSVWPMYGASHPIWESNVATTMTLAAEEHLNLVRLTDWMNVNGPLTGAYAQSQWDTVDAYIAAASAQGLHVVLDLSTYRNLLWNNCVGPSYDWSSFLNWVAHRVNTVSGRVYADDPTIAMVSLAGEYNPPTTYTYTDNSGSSCTMSYSTSDLTSFFERTLSEARADFPNQLVDTGGFSYLDWNSGIDWKTIMADPNDQVCAVHVYSSGDAGTTVPNVSSYCRGLGKPWIIEEFGFQQSLGDAVRAQDVQGRYTLARDYGAAGVAFWNLGPQVQGVNYSATTYDINPQTPLTFAVVVRNAP